MFFKLLIHDDFSLDEFSTIYTVDPLKSSASFTIPVPSPPSLYPDNQGILVFTHDYWHLPSVFFQFNIMLS